MYFSNRSFISLFSFQSVFTRLFLHYIWTIAISIVIPTTIITLMHNLVFKS
nr:MAG TPA: hypothetical protein [Bacteriophage sp.]